MGTVYVITFCVQALLIPLAVLEYRKKAQRLREEARKARNRREEQ